MTKTNLWQTAERTGRGFRDVEPRALALHRQRERVVDVREPYEFDDALGHVPGAELVPLREVGMSASHWDRSEPLVVVCRSGGRSGRAAELLGSMGFTQVMNLRGGMLDWAEDGLPVERAALAQ